MVLSCPFWSTVLPCGAGGMFECDLAHRRSVAVLCKLYKIWYNPLHPLYGALPVPHVWVWVTRGPVIAHRYTYAIPGYRTSQYLRTFILLSVWCGSRGQC